MAGEALWNSGLVNLLAGLGKELEVEIRELMSPLNISFIFFFFLHWLSLTLKSTGRPLLALTLFLNLFCLNI